MEIRKHILAMRIFIGISFSSYQKQRINNTVTTYLNKLLRTIFEDKVIFNNHHLTLAFIGNTNENKLQQTIEAMNKMRLPRGFFIYFDNISCFPNKSKSKIISLIPKFSK